MLRSSTELARYDVEATDGAIGNVRDFYFDDRTWHIRHMVIDLSGFLNNDLLISPQDIATLKFPEEVIVLDLDKAEVASRPEAGSAPPVSRQRQDSSGQPQASHDPHLRSANTMAAYRVATTDGELGHVHGLMIETTTWTIRYLIVDTGELLTAKMVLLAPQAISRIDWQRALVTVDVPSDTVRNCPQYDGNAELNREYEAFLHDYYGWPPYWN